MRKDPARQKGLRYRNSPTCTLSQNGYGADDGTTRIKHRKASGMSQEEANQRFRALCTLPHAQHAAAHASLPRVTSGAMAQRQRV